MNKEIIKMTDIKIEDVLRLVDNLIIITKVLKEKESNPRKFIAPRNSGLSTLEKKIIEGTWNNESYDVIAKLDKYDKKYLSNYGTELWQLITKALQKIGLINLEQKVTKKSFRSFIELRNEEIEFKLLNFKKNVSKKDINFSYGLIESSEEKMEIKQLKLPEGPLSIESNLYLERPPCEADCYHMITEPGSLIRIKAPNQMGKTSLIMRILEQAKSHNYSTLYLNLPDIDRTSLSDLDVFLREFAFNITDQLNRLEQLNISDEEMTKNWKQIFAAKKRCNLYFENFLLPRLDKILVLAIDEVDYLFFEEVATEFFTMLRNWHEKAKRTGTEELWSKLRIILSHSTEPYLEFNDNLSPFNVGLAIDLPELNSLQISHLSQKYSLKLNSNQIDELVSAIGGHPYLIQLAIYYLATNKISLKDLLKTAHTEQGIYSSHLRRHLMNLQKQADLKSALIQVLQNTKPVALNSIERFRLYGAGLVKIEGNKVFIRCQLYRKYFSENLL